MRASAVALSVLAFFCGLSAAHAGTVCINQVSISEKMLALSGGEDPGRSYHFTVSVGRKAAVAASPVEAVLIRDVPTSRPQMIAIQLNGRPYAAFPLDFASYRTPHVCLWLNDLYLTWSVSAMSEARGRCSCKS